MPAHFAGSASVSDRRRRRLAREIEWKQSVPTSTKSSRSSRGSSLSEEESAEAEPVAVQSRRWSLIPFDHRLLALVCAVNVLCWMAVLWLGISDWAAARGLEQLTSLNDGTTLRFFSVVQILATSQLCFLIYWYRSRSRKDFMGRYRIWSWAGLFWGVVCLCLATNVQFTFVRSMLERFDLDAWRPETLSWLFPLSIGMIPLYRVLRREMRLSRPSLIAWEISFCLAVVSALLAMGLENLFSESIRNTINVAVWSLWHVSLTLTCLIHARHVVHVSNEAPPRLPSRGTKLLRWSYRRLIVVGERVLSARLLSRSASTEAPTASEPKEKTRRSRRVQEQVQTDVAATSVESDATPSRRREPPKVVTDSDNAANPKKAFFIAALMTAGAAKAQVGFSGIKSKGSALIARFSLRKTSEPIGNESTTSSAQPTPEQKNLAGEITPEKMPSKGMFSFFKKGEQKPFVEGEATKAPAVTKPVVAEAPKKKAAKPNAEETVPEKAPSKGMFSFFKKGEQKPVVEGEATKSPVVTKPVVAEAPKKEAAKPKADEAVSEKAPSKGKFSFFKKGEQKPVVEGEAKKSPAVTKPVVAEAPKKEVAKPKAEEAVSEKAPSKGMFSFFKKGEQKPVVEGEAKKSPIVTKPVVAEAPKKEAPKPKAEEAVSEKAPSKGMFSFFKKGEQKPVVEEEAKKSPVVTKPVVAEAPKKEAPKPKAEEAVPEKAPSKGLFPFFKKGEQNLRVDSEPKANPPVPTPHVTVASKPEKATPAPAPAPAPPKAVSEPTPAPTPVKPATPTPLPKETVSETSAGPLAAHIKSSDRREIPESDYSSNYDEEYSEPNYDDDDDNMSRMSSKQRKKLKKQQRQQARSKDDFKDNDYE